MAGPVGSWYALSSVLKDQKAEFEWYQSAPPWACPNDGEPLLPAPATLAGSGCELYCKYDGFQYPRDWVRPERGQRL